MQRSKYWCIFSLFQEYEKDTEKYRKSLQEKVPKPKYEPAHIIADEIDRVTESLKKIEGDCQSLMEKLSETAIKNRKFNDLKHRLVDSLPKIESRMDRCDTELKPGGDPKKQLDDLNTLTADVIAEGKRVEDFKSLGDELLGILEDLDCKDTPKAKEIQSNVDSVNEKFDYIQERLWQTAQAQQGRHGRTRHGP